MKIIMKKAETIKHEQELQAQTKQGKKIYENLSTDDKERLINQIIDNSHDKYIQSKIELFGFESSPQNIKDHIYREINKTKS